MPRSLVDLANAWGFTCFQDPQGNWKISSSQNHMNWQLQQIKDNQWLILFADLPQMYLPAKEVLQLLEYYRSEAKIKV